MKKMLKIKGPKLALIVIIWCLAINNYMVNVDARHMLIRSLPQKGSDVLKSGLLQNSGNMLDNPSTLANVNECTSPSSINGLFVPRLIIEPTTDKCEQTMLTASATTKKEEVCESTETPRSTTAEYTADEITTAIIHDSSDDEREKGSKGAMAKGIVTFQIYVKNDNEGRSYKGQQQCGQIILPPKENNQRGYEGSVNEYKKVIDKVLLDPILRTLLQHERSRRHINVKKKLQRRHPKGHRKLRLGNPNYYFTN